MNKIYRHISICLLLGLSATPSAWAVSCGDFIVSNVTLTSDLHCSTGFYALEVGANNVTVDLNGFILSGNSGLAGIIAVGRNNVTVKNGVIRGFWAGINSAQTDNLNVFDNIFFDLGAGVIISSGNNAKVTGNDFIFTTAQGVSIANHVPGMTATGNQVANNEFYETRIGVEICGGGADSNSIESNLIWKSMDYGINIIDSNDNQIYDNTVRETTGTAVRLNNASNNQMFSNSLRVGNHGLAIYAQAGSPCAPGSSTSSKYNVFKGNHSIDFDIGVILGLGISSSALVYKNQITFNKIYDDNIGILFNTDAHINDATGNAYSGTVTPINDMGTGNIY